MLTILFGSNNLHKLQEVKRILSKFNIISPNDLGFSEEAIEDGTTFRENAIIKARFYAERLNIPCLADDSGLMIDALDGLPGVRSARFAGGVEENIKLILKLMKDVPFEKRTARFVCIMAFYNPATKDLYTTEGSVEGIITFRKKGREGFGYDPIFFYPYLGKTFAELDIEAKNRLSHRYVALMEMRDYLIEHLKD